MPPRPARTFRSLLAAALAALASVPLSAQPPAEANPDDELPEQRIDREGSRAWRAIPAPAVAPGVEPWQAPPLREPDMNWVRAQLAEMTLDEKIGQMIMPVWSRDAAVSQLATYNVGGFCFGVSDSRTVLDAANRLQSLSRVPLIFSMDCEAGAGARIRDATVFPMNMALAATGRADLAFMQGVVTARECRAMGVHIAFGPVVDTNTEPANPIIGIRAYGDDPAAIARFAEAYIDGARSAGLLTTLKHYPGHGATAGDSHLMLPTVDLPALEFAARHLRPYEILLAHGRGDLVMTAHVWYPAYDVGPAEWPATLSPVVLGEVLRRRLSFGGALISDSFAMAGVRRAASTYEGVRMSVESGLDIVLMPPNIADAVAGLRDAVLSGTMSESRLDEAVARVLVMKSRVGLPEMTFVDEADFLRTVRHPSHIAVTEEIGAAAIASARIEPGVLPLRPEHKVLCLSFAATSSIFYLYAAATFTGPLQEQVPFTTVRTVASDFPDAELAGIVADAQDYDRVLVVSRMWKPTNSGAQDELLRRLVASPARVIYVGFGSPYHHLQVPGLRNILCSFSNHHSSQRKMVEVLTGRAASSARWPVETGLAGKTEAWMFE